MASNSIPDRKRPINSPSEQDYKRSFPSMPSGSEFAPSGCALKSDDKVMPMKYVTSKAENDSSFSEQFISQTSSQDSEDSMKRYPEQTSESDMESFDSTSELSDTFAKVTISTQESSSLEDSVQNSQRISSVETATIRPEEYPEQYKLKQFDAVIVCHETDALKAAKIKEVMEKFVILEDRRPVAICVLDKNGSLGGGQSVFEELGEAVERSTFMFLLMTEKFATDSWTRLKKEECLAESLDDPDKKWSVVPLHVIHKSKRKFKYPFGLRSVKGIDISDILGTKSLDDVDVNEIKEEDFAKYFLQDTANQFNRRLSQKLERERCQEEELGEWIANERARREMERVRMQARVTEEMKHQEATRAQHTRNQSAQGRDAKHHKANPQPLVINYHIYQSNVQIGDQNIQTVNENIPGQDSDLREQSIEGDIEVVEMESETQNQECQDSSIHSLAMSNAKVGESNVQVPYSSLVSPGATEVNDSFQTNQPLGTSLMSEAGTIDSFEGANQINGEDAEVSNVSTGNSVLGVTNSITNLKLVDGSNQGNAASATNDVISQENTASVTNDGTDNSRDKQDKPGSNAGACVPRGDDSLRSCNHSIVREQPSTDVNLLDGVIHGTESVTENSVHAVRSTPNTSGHPNVIVNTLNFNIPDDNEADDEADDQSDADDEADDHLSLRADEPKEANREDAPNLMNRKTGEDAPSFDSGIQSGGNMQSHEDMLPYHGAKNQGKPVD